jgi:hypothetical protein
MTYYISLFVYIHIYIKSEFTESFIGGMYRDSRMGVSELRQKRVLRLAKKRQVIEDAQEKVMEEVRRKKRYDEVVHRFALFCFAYFTQRISFPLFKKKKLTLR